jgi:hypothetical protein
MCFIHTNTEINTRTHDAYKLICGNNRWWPEKRFYRRWQRCFCSACALYRPCRPPTLMPVLVLWKKKKLFRDYVNLGSFSDNKTETCIKSSRFKSHKRRQGGGRGKKGLRWQAWDFIRETSWMSSRDFLNFFIVPWLLFNDIVFMQ